ncbi:hypothetical protein KFE98_04170 [bacterium SCSIO 12741]|nr:hypothetical protein KFE98_04170 [bacterium SCSIO 12741]
MKHLLTTLFAALLYTGLSAQDFEVAPVVMSYQVEPGNIETKKVTITNHANEPQRFVFKMADYGVNEKGGKYSMEVGTSERSLSSWMTINPGYLDLNPNESATFDVIITVPQNNFQTRWGMIHVQSREKEGVDPIDKDKTAAGVIVLPRIAILVKQSPKSNNNYKSRVFDLHELDEKFNGFRVFEVTVENTGDKIVEGELSLALANIETAVEEKYQPKKITVYPGHPLKVKLVLPTQLSPGNYALAALFNYGHRQPIEATQVPLTVK